MLQTKHAWLQVEHPNNTKNKTNIHAYKPLCRTKSLKITLMHHSFKFRNVLDIYGGKKKNLICQNVICSCASLITWLLSLSRLCWTHLREDDRPVQHPQPAGTSPVKVHRYRTCWHQQVGMACQPAPRLLLLLHGTLWPAQLLLCCWEWEQSTCSLQPDGEDASAVWTTSRQTWWCLELCGYLSTDCSWTHVFCLMMKNSCQIFFF